MLPLPKNVGSIQILLYVTGAIVCSRITYSNSRYDGILRVEENNLKNNRENTCDFKRNNILDQCYHDEERNTREPYAPLYPPVLCPHTLPLCHPSPTSFATYLRVLFTVRLFRRLRFRTLPVSNIFATSLVPRRPLSRGYARSLACTSLSFPTQHVPPGDRSPWFYRNGHLYGLTLSGPVLG
jgi:hypothetical protein